MSRHFRLALMVGLAALSLGASACSKSNADPSSTTTTNGDSLNTAPSGNAPPPGAPGAPGAVNPPGQRGQGRRMQAFLDGCAGKNANDACNVQLPSRALTGTCLVLPNGPNQGQLSCRPAPGQLGPHHPGMDNPTSASSIAPPAAPRPGDPGYQPPPAHPAAAN